MTPTERKCLTDGLVDSTPVVDVALTVFLEVKALIFIAFTFFSSTPAAISCVLSSSNMASELVVTAATFASTAAALDVGTLNE